MTHQTELPPSLTLMQTVAWIVTRDSLIVCRASLNPDDCARANDHLSENHWCSRKGVGLDFHNINLRAERSDAAEDATAELQAAFQTEKLTATGQEYRPTSDEIGRRAAMKGQDWAGLFIAPAADDPRELSLYRTVSDRSSGTSKQIVPEWRYVLVAREDLLFIWPPHLLDNSEITAAATPCRQAKSINEGPRAYLSSAEALGLLAFGKKDCLSGKMHEFAAIWPASAALSTKWDEQIDEIRGHHHTLKEVLLRYHHDWTKRGETQVESGNWTQAEADRQRVLKGERLRDDLKLADTEWEHREARIADADRRLREAASLDRDDPQAILVWGKRGSRSRGKLSGLQHELIPPEFFMDANRTITREGWATIAGRLPMDAGSVGAKPSLLIGAICDFPHRKSIA